MYFNRRLGLLDSVQVFRHAPSRKVLTKRERQHRNKKRRMQKAARRANR